VSGTSRGWSVRPLESAHVAGARAMMITVSELEELIAQTPDGEQVLDWPSWNVRRRRPSCRPSTAWVLTNDRLPQRAMQVNARKATGRCARRSRFHLSKPDDCWAFPKARFWPERPFRASKPRCRNFTGIRRPERPRVPPKEMHARSVAPVQRPPIEDAWAKLTSPKW
jgi:hypothetical protein